MRSSVGHKTEIVEMDWWEDRVVSVEGKGDVKVTCSELRSTGGEARTLR